MSLTSWEKFKKGEKITRKQAIQAQCYECNGYTILKADNCHASHCPLYEWSPWGKSREIRLGNMTNLKLSGMKQLSQKEKEV